MALDNNARIQDYWIRRKDSQSLTPAEWEDFYRLVVALLIKTQLGPEYAEKQSRMNLINAFFADKIFLNAHETRAGPLESAYALHGYLKNYASDLRRDARRTTSIDDYEFEAADEDFMLEDTATEMAEHPAHSHSRLLKEAGIDLATASRSAGAFLKMLDEGEIAMLNMHTCADDEDRQPVSSIAKRLALGSSYHYRIKKLGITRSKGELFAGYEQSKIGGWLASLGVKMHHDWAEEIACLLMLLCQTAAAVGSTKP